MADDPRDAQDRRRRRRRRTDEAASADAAEPVPHGEGPDPHAAAPGGADPEPDAVVPDPEDLDALAGHLVWRIGRTSDDAPVTVRVGLAGSTPAFAELPRLRNASDAEIQEALDSDAIRVEWVGPRGR